MHAGGEGGGGGPNLQNEKALTFLKSDPKQLSPDEYRNLFTEFIQKVSMMDDDEEG